MIRYKKRYKKRYKNEYKEEYSEETRKIYSKNSLDSGVKGFVHSVETLGTLDGPGIRTIFFMQGCGLRCLYCHNPDTWGNGGKEYSVADVVNTARRYKDYYGTTGGVTFSGGEPLLQGNFLVSCMLALREEGVSVALDTAGTPFLPKVLALADYILLDVKHTSSEGFNRLTGGDIAHTLNSLQYIKDMGIACKVRQVIVRGHTNNEENVRRLKKLAGGMEVELLRYHTLGVHKYAELGLEYGLDGEVSEEEMLRFRAMVK